MPCDTTLWPHSYSHRRQYRCRASNLEMFARSCRLGQRAIRYHTTASPSFLSAPRPLANIQPKSLCASALPSAAAWLYDTTMQPQFRSYVVRDHWPTSSPTAFARRRFPEQQPFDTSLQPQVHSSPYRVRWQASSREVAARRYPPDWRARATGMAQSNVSRTIAAMISVGAVKTTRQGKHIVCRISSRPIVNELSDASTEPQMK